MLAARLEHCYVRDAHRAVICYAYIVTILNMLDEHACAAHACGKSVMLLSMQLAALQGFASSLC